MHEPGLQNVVRDEIDLVEDEDEAFGGIGEDEAFGFWGSCTGGIAGVKDVEDYVGGGDCFLKGFGVGAAGGVFFWCGCDGHVVETVEGRATPIFCASVHVVVVWNSAVVVVLVGTGLG